MTDDMPTPDEMRELLAKQNTKDVPDPEPEADATDGQAQQ